MQHCVGLTPESLGCASPDGGAAVAAAANPCSPDITSGLRDCGGAPDVLSSFSPGATRRLSQVGFLPPSFDTARTKTDGCVVCHTPSIGSKGDPAQPPAYATRQSDASTWRAGGKPGKPTCDPHNSIP